MLRSHWDRSSHSENNLEPYFMSSRALTSLDEYMEPID
jgi:hypothetical protein